jgi:AmmeMemoRadiSam system protein B
MIRQPAVAGQFYPGSAPELKKMIGSMVREGKEKEEAIGMVLPHAGYIYSGAVVGAVLSRIKFKDTFIIMGPNHTGAGRPLSIMTEGSWQTPLGEVEIDAELAKKILAGSRHLEEDDRAQIHEHSIEVQLPFLQYFKPDFRLVPMVFGHPSGDIYKEVGREIAAAVKELGREVVIVASSDMSHYEPQDSAQKKDTQAIGAMLKLDEDELLKRVFEQNITMCGYAPAVSLIVAAKELGASGAELVKYQTSGDVTGDYTGVVGYAGIIIKGGG